MKLFFNEPDVVAVQKRDLQYLADIGCIPYNLYSEQMKNYKESDFILIQSEDVVHDLKKCPDIIDYFDYLNMDIEQLRILTDEAEDDYSTMLAVYRKNVKRKKDNNEQYKLITKKRYQFNSLVEMMEDKQENGKILDLPFKFMMNQDQYFSEDEQYATCATKVDNMYIIRAKDGSPLSIFNKDFKQYMSQEMVHILVDISRHQEEKQQDYSIHVVRPKDEDMMLFIAQPIEKQKVKSK